MKTIEHGISVGISRVDNFFFMKLKITGTLTHDDYAKMTPMLRESIKGVKEPSVKMLIDATEFDGYEIRAAWDDFKFGMEFKDIFTNIAFIGTKSWEEYGVKIGNWFIGADMKFFKDIDKAYEWLSKEDIQPNTPVEKDLYNRKDAIRDDLESLFKSNLRVTDYNVPEPNDQDASEIIINILEEKLREIKADVEEGKYK
ncbi:MAG: hypothetical protein ACJAWW_000039 [Sulfurimonas sp.]|jgi:hypothetical protein